VQEGLAILNHQGIVPGIRNIVLYRVHELGELTLNAPSSKLGRLSPFVWLFGTATVAGLIMCARRCRFGFVEAYLTGYLMILLVWPYGDTRFWTPILPLVLAELFVATQPWNFAGWKRRLSLAYAVIYTLLGFAALAYSTRITFSGREFPYRFGDDHLRSTYAFLYSESQDRSKVDPSALEVLQRYGR
jgi:hypothetical protein